MMRGDPWVSIVTPSYNQGRYIEETIQSVLNQGYPNLEYIVIDGSSTDNTMDILKKYEQHLVWVSEKDRGQADAINKGFHMARGEILAWLNSDDTYQPGAICKAVQYFEAHPEVGLLYGEGYHIDDDGEVIERYYTEPFNYQRLGEICFICQPTVFMRTEVVRAVGPLDLNLDYCLDYDYWMRVAKHFRIGYLNEHLANSRLHTDTKTLSKQVEVHQENLQVVKKHYGQVPVRWINAYAHVFLTAKLMPKCQGYYEDGWAAPHARFSLPGDWPRYAYLILQGICPDYARPLPLKIMLGDRVLHKEVIEDQNFTVTAKLGPNPELSQPMLTSEVKLYAGKSFVPHMIHTNADTRTLSYRVKKLSLVDTRGRELTLSARQKHWLFAMALPMISLKKSLVINRRFCGKEVWQTTRDLWSGLIKSPFRSVMRHN